MCDDWRNDFKLFYQQVGPRPSKKHSIDRIDPNGNYEPGNVRWVTRREQANNRRNTRFVTYEGVRMPLTEAIRLNGSVIHPQAAWNRITHGHWSVKAAVRTPPTFTAHNKRIVEAH